jgi:hypothetical protein
MSDDPTPQWQHDNEEGAAHEEAALAAIREAMKHPEVALHLVYTFTHGRGIQVKIKTRKIGPLIFPANGGTLSDTLRMLGDMADE